MSPGAFTDRSSLLTATRAGPPGCFERLNQPRPRTLRSSSSGRPSVIFDHGPARSSERRLPMRHLHPEPTLVKEAMVRAAQQQQVGEVGLASVGPVAYMVRVTPSIWPGATRESALLVPEDDRTTDRGRHHPSPPSPLICVPNTTDH